MPARFVNSLFQMLESPDVNIHWGDSNQIIFPDDLQLPDKYFRTNQLKSFIRQLNFYGFKCVEKKNSSNKYVYIHELFTRNGENLKKITRKKIVKKRKSNTNCQDLKENKVSKKRNTNLKSNSGINVPKSRKSNYKDTFTFDFLEFEKLFEEKEEEEEKLPFDIFIENCIPLKKINPYLV